MKILIINPPFYRLQGASLVHYPPSCCYMAATLEKAGFDSIIYNADYDPNKKTILGNTNHINVSALIHQHIEYERRLHSDDDSLWKEISDYIEQQKPDILILSVFNTTLTAGNKIARITKNLAPTTLTVFEGWSNRGLHCAVDPSEVGDFSIMDFAIRKEPEKTIVELVQALEAQSKDFSNIKGLSWKDSNGDVIHNAERPFLTSEELEQLPFPARHKIDGYENMPPHTFQGLYGSRGCPFDCVFCGCHISMGKKVRTRSARSLVEEIEVVHKKYGTRYFFLCDDIFFFYKKRAREFCRLLLERQLPIYWTCQTKAEIMDDETLALMKKAGGQHVSIGVEVGNPEIRKLIKKGNTVEDVRNCAKLIKKHGLFMVAFCMIGLPWETRKEIEETVHLIKEINPYIVFPYLPTPAVGTELAEIMLQKNPDGLKEFRDRCHIDTSVGVTGGMDADERKEVLNWALDEFVKMNKKSLIQSFSKRLGFYWALAHDMGFLNKPSYIFQYLKDYVSG